jgi:hypothetical protein
MHLFTDQIRSGSSVPNILIINPETVVSYHSSMLIVFLCVLQLTFAKMFMGLFFKTQLPGILGQFVL